MNRHCRFLALTTIVLVALILTGCEQVAVATPQPITLKIGGSTAMQPVLAALAEAFSRDHPNVLFDIRGGGSTLGEARVLAQEIDIAASTLLPDDMRPDEGISDDQATGQSGDLRALLVHTPIGLDSIAIIVNQQNEIESLSIQELRDLFNGRTLDWTSIGGLGDEVRLVSREDGSGTRALFEERIMGDEAVSLTAVVMPSSADVVDYVAKQPLAIGYVSEGYVLEGQVSADSMTGAFVADEVTGDEDAQGGAPRDDDIRVVAVEGRLPNAALDSEEPYFLTRPLFLVTNGEPSGRSRQFVDFALGPAGQAIVDRYHTRIR